MSKGRILLAVALVAMFGSAWAADYRVNLTVSDPHVRAVPPGQANTGAFMGIANHSDVDRAIVAAESDISKTVELHTHVMEGGMMKMREIEKIDLPAGQEVMLKPGGLHVMFLGLHKDLEIDQEVAIALVLEDGSKLVVNAPVRKIHMKMKKHGHQGSH